MKKIADDIKASFFDVTTKMWQKFYDFMIPHKKNRMGKSFYRDTHTFKLDAQSEQKGSKSGYIKL